MLPVVTLIAQPKTNQFTDPREAEEHFSHNNFLAAIPVYKKLLAQEPTSKEYNYKLGLCYLHTNINKALAISYLETASKQEKVAREVFFDLGLAYQYAGRLDDAINAYNKYEFTKGLPANEVKRTEHQIETCENGKEYMKHPVNVTFQNLGKEVNSEFPDYYPFVSADESFLIFTSRRKGNIGGQLEVDGYYSSDIYISTSQNGNWTKSKNMGALINTRYDEQAVSLTADGQTMILYIDHIDSLGNIYSSQSKSGTFQKMRKLNSNVNSDFETSGSISPDGNTIFFTSKRDGGIGETDIYMSRKLPNEQWGMAQNLGKTINTSYKEDFPEIAPDGKTLYFSSQGHDGMGDFDLFKSTWNEERNTWTTPKNLGYPVNSVGDDHCISFTQDNRIAYISAIRSGGQGDLDIYRIKFNDTEDKTTLIFGYVSGVEGVLNTIANVSIVNLKNKNAQPFASQTNPTTGKFIIALTPGLYEISIDAKGYKTLTETLSIFDIGTGQNESKKNFVLQKE